MKQFKTYQQSVDQEAGVALSWIQRNEGNEVKCCLLFVESALIPCLGAAGSFDTTRATEARWYITTTLLLNPFMTRLGEARRIG